MASGEAFSHWSAAFGATGITVADTVMGFIGCGIFRILTHLVISSYKPRFAGVAQVWGQQNVDSDIPE